MSGAAFFARWRVRLGYPLALLVLWLARPTPSSIVGGAAIAIIGLLIRAAAAGHLRKQEVLTTTGPYAYTRNPLYFGSFILILGVSVLAHSWLAALFLCGYFALFYSVVMRREERELFQQHGTAFEQYARAVPLFFPRIMPANVSAASGGSFSFAQYKKNREYRAGVGFVLLLAIFVVIWRLRLPH